MIRSSRFARSVDGESVHVHGDHVYALWEDQRLGAVFEPYFGRSVDGGASFTEQPIGPGLTGNTTHFVMKVVRSDAGPDSDEVHTVHLTNDVSNTAAEALHYRGSLDGGASFGPSLLLSPVVATGSFGERSTALHADEARVVVAWVDSGAVRIRRSIDRGASFEPAVRLDTSKVNGPPVPLVATSAEGSLLAVAWVQATGAGTSEVAVRRSLDGGASFSAPVSLGGTTGHEITQVIVRVIDGNVVVLWTDDGPGPSGVHRAVSTDGGLQYALTPLALGEEGRYLRMVASGNRMAASWRDELAPGSSRLRVSYSLDAGLSWAGPLTINGGNTLGDEGVLALGDGDQVLAAWHGEPTPIPNSVGSFAYAGGFRTTAASAALRTAGTNVASYSASPAIIGGPWTATVDLSLTGHTMALIRIQSAPALIPRGNGEYFLTGGALLGQSPLLAGPLAQFQVTLPNDPSLSGLELFTQAAHLGGVVPYALGNARDLTLGTF